MQVDDCGDGYCGGGLVAAGDSNGMIRVINSKRWVSQGAVSDEDNIYTWLTGSICMGKQHSTIHFCLN